MADGVEAEAAAMAVAAAAGDEFKAEVGAPGAPNVCHVGAQAWQR
jgi:hypothetical protein